MLWVYGETKMVFATGERSGCQDISLKVSDMKVSGKIQRKNVDLREFTSYLMKRILDFLQKDSRKLLKVEPTPTQ